MLARLGELLGTAFVLGVRRVDPIMVGIDGDLVPPAVQRCQRPAGEEAADMSGVGDRAASVRHLKDLVRHP